MRTREEAKRREEEIQRARDEACERGLKIILEDRNRRVPPVRMAAVARENSRRLDVYLLTDRRAALADLLHPLEGDNIDLSGAKAMCRMLIEVVGIDRSWKAIDRVRSLIRREGDRSSVAPAASGLNGNANLDEKLDRLYQKKRFEGMRIICRELGLRLDSYFSDKPEHIINFVNKIGSVWDAHVKNGDCYFTECSHEVFRKSAERFLRAHQKLEITEIL